MKLIARIEPGIWALFGAGFMVGSLLLPAWIFVVWIAAPRTATLPTNDALTA